MKQTLLFLILLSTVSLVSCQQEEGSNDFSSVEDAARRIGFVQYDGNSSFENHISRVAAKDPQIHIGIKARIATKKSGCLKGFGLCDFRPYSGKVEFQEADRSSNSTTQSDYTPYDCATYCVVDSSGVGTVYFLLADTPESQQLTCETMPPLMVEEEMEQPVEDNPQDTIVALPGAYHYQKNLGDFGGYTISVKYNGTK